VRRASKQADKKATPTKSKLREDGSGTETPPIITLEFAYEEIRIK
jgi:hypothetical protein